MHSLTSNSCSWSGLHMWCTCTICEEFLLAILIIHPTQYLQLSYTIAELAALQSFSAIKLQLSIVYAPDHSWWQWSKYVDSVSPGGLNILGYQDVTPLYGCSAWARTSWGMWGVMLWGLWIFWIDFLSAMNSYYNTNQTCANCTQLGWNVLL